MDTNTQESAAASEHEREHEQPIDQTSEHEQEHEQPIDQTAAAPLHNQDHASYPQISAATADHVDSQHASSAGGWGAPVMGVPSNPSAHPLNSQAATGEIVDPPPPYSAVDHTQVEPLQSPRDSETLEQRAPIPSAAGGGDGDPRSQQSNPYVQTDPVSGSAAADKSPMDTIVEDLNKFGKKVEEEIEKLWNHLMAGTSVTDTAWGRINQGAKVLSEGGIENVFKQTFSITTNEQLRKSYACYMSTSTGPVVGTFYISTVKIAFCSDLPLQHSPTPDQRISSYYKVVIPLERLKAANASANKDKPAEKYIQIVTLDDYEFWFMGFVNYDKGLKNLQEAIQNRSSQEY